MATQHVDITTTGGAPGDAAGGATMVIHQQPPPPPPASSPDTTTGPAGTGPILSRLKELEAANQAMSKGMEELKGQLSAKDEKIKDLSADKRKEMEGLIDTAIDTWLNSLTGISDDVKKQFRSGISKLAEHADVRNTAWEVVCQASTLHQSNVARIEGLVTQINEQNETIKSLVGSTPPAADSSSFASDASRMMARGFASGAPSAVGGSKRPRTEDAPAAPSAAMGGEAWNMFSSLLQEHAKNTYY